MKMGQILIKTFNIDKRVIIEGIAKILTDYQKTVFLSFQSLEPEPDHPCTEDNMDGFISDLILSFRLTSPTIIYHCDAPEICFTTPWVLCLHQDVLKEGKETKFYF